MKTIDDVIAHMRRPGAPDDDDWPLDYADTPLHVTAYAKPVSNLFLTKSQAFGQFFDVRSATSELSKYGLVDDGAIATMAPLLRDLPRLIFVGDMDPIDLTVFCFLRDRLKGVDVVYAGVGGGWLDHVPAWAVMRLSNAERENWAALTEACPDIRDAIGETGSSFLDAGEKIELEGASNPAIIDSEQRRAIQAHMRTFGIELEPRAR